MDTRKVATEYRLAQWAEIVQLRLSRGQSIKSFCGAEGISKNTYFYWQRKLREAACAELERSQESNVIQSDLIKYEPVPVGWTQLSSVESQDSSLTIEVGGCRVIVNSDTDPALLSQTLRTLKAL